MPFVAGDKNINREGRIDKKRDKLTNRDLKERELLMLLRKIKPHVAESILTAAKIMKNEKSSEGGKLRAAVILLDNYRKLSLDLYGGEEEADNDATEVQEENNTPMLSLRVLDSTDNS
jgi:hypothetical protein